MADLDKCVFCEEPDPITWMLTHLRPAATVHSCEKHAVTNLVGLLATLLEVDMDWLWSTLDTAVNALVAEQAAEPEPEPEVKPKQRKRSAPKPELHQEAEDAAV